MAQNRFWNAEAAERWKKNAARLEAGLRPFSAALLDRLAPSPDARLADIGCGAGDFTIELARHVKQGEVTGVDISPALLDVARAHAGTDLPHLSFLEADAAAWRPGAALDALTSRFGVMFFPDPVAAFANLRAMLKPGGRMVFAAWTHMAENDWISVPLAAVLDAMGEPRPDPLPIPYDDTPGPFGLASKGRLESILTEAGWADINIGRWTGAMEYPAQSAEDLAGFMATMGAVARLVENGAIGQDAALKAVTDTIAPLWSPDGPPQFRGSAWIVSIRAPDA